MRVAAILMLALGLCVTALDLDTARAASAHAQANPAEVDAARQARVRRAPTRLVIRPTRRFYRECVSWLQPEARPSGTVITPQMRCRWAVR